MTINPRELRDALGQFATGVCVITASPDGWGPIGITANSFASVSLSPPLVLWSLQNDSELFGAFEAAAGYAVNILRGDQQGLSSRYAQKGGHELDPAHFESGAGGLPVIPGSLVSLECAIHARHSGGDHVILVGEVTHLTAREPGPPLLFCAGAYRALAAPA